MTGAGVSDLVVITHVDGADTRWVRALADHIGASLQQVRPYAGDELPEPGEGMATVVLGGPMSARDDLPFLAEEMRFIRALVDAGRPVIGICLGAQLLTRALGGDVVVLADGPETGFIEVIATPAAGASGLDGLLERRSFSFHRDAMVPPAGVQLLAVSARCPQAWSCGSALAVQFHPELSAEGLREFAAIEADLIAGLGLDMDAVVSEQEADEAAARQAWLDLADAWFATGQSTHR